MRIRPSFLALLVTLQACAGGAGTSTSSRGAVAPAIEGEPRVGILVMAHGGGEVWNRAVADAVAPLRDEVPTAIAFGMADPHTLQAGLDSLGAAGAERVAVVRLFVSGESFLDQTTWLLGLSDARPAFIMAHGAGAQAEIGPLRHHLEVATHAAGLMQSAEAAGIMADRARAGSTGRASESVLLIAHGMGDEAANRAVLDAMERMATDVRRDGFASVRVATLREDWAEARERSEADIRTFVGQEQASGRNVIVVPMRLSGFGPYASVLDGFEYVATEGLLPHPLIGDWVRNTAVDVACANGWPQAIGPCRATTVHPT